MSFHITIPYMMWLKGKGNNMCLALRLPLVSTQDKKEFWYNVPIDPKNPIVFFFHHLHLLLLPRVSLSIFTKRRRKPQACFSSLLSFSLYMFYINFCYRQNGQCGCFWVYLHKALKMINNSRTKRLCEQLYLNANPVLS